MDPLNPMSLTTNETGVFQESLTCFTLPPKINSPGMAEYLIDKSFSYTLPNLEVLMSVIFVVYRCLHFAFKRMGLPPLVSQIATGLIFNPTLLPHKVSSVLFPKQGLQNLVICGTLGYQMFMFQSGIKMELDLLKTIKAKVLLVGVLCVLLPLLLGLTTLSVITDHAQVLATLFTATTCSITSFPAIVSLLNDQKLLNSKVGRLGLSTALISDLFSFTLLAISFSLGTAGQELNGNEYDLTVILVFILVVAFILRPALKQLAKKASHADLYLKKLYIHVIMALYLGSASLSHLNKLAVLYGPFIIGLAVPSGPPLGTAVLDMFEAMTGYIIVLLTAACGMRVDFANAKFNKGTVAIAAVSFTVISLVKFLTCYSSHLFFWKSQTQDAIAYALIMSTKGVVDLALFSFLNDNQDINDDVFISMLGAIMVSVSFVPILLRRLYNPTKKYIGFKTRNLVDSRSNSELCIVSCIHVPGDVNAAINLLDFLCSGDSPIEITVLHHIKLLGQSTPIFISHRKERIIVCDYLYSENVIRILNEFEQSNRGYVSVNAVTAVSLPKFMYDDIWTVAGDNMASLIILPFHVRWWKQDGSIQSQDQTIRELNKRVLEKSPCSVGILVEGCNNRWAIHKESEPTTLKVAMIFLSGNDDREALSFAIRMAQDTRVDLCVRHLVATHNEGHQVINDDLNELEMEQDTMALNDAREMKYITIIEEMVDGAAKTAALVKSMLNEYEFIVVGRRNNLNDITPQTAGLEQWCEYPELGLIGDMILSEDTVRKCSLFVVQQAQSEQKREQQ